MMNYLECWTSVATALFSQALAGEPNLEESLPKPMSPGAFAFTANISGEEAGRFVIILDPGLLEAPLMGEGMDQKAGWSELLREVADAASGELYAKTGRKCHVDSFEETAPESQISRAFQLKTGDRAWTVLVRDEVRQPKPAAPPPQPKVEAAEQQAAPPPPPPPPPPIPQPSALSPGVELLLDIELEAALRFGCREMPLAEILKLGPGDVVQLDRHVADPVDLIVGDKIVARGEVVLVNGNFGLRVTEVSAPRKRLESIRCLF